MTTHDDVPHPVPPTAHLRYKENWFWIFLDVRNQIFGMAHFNYEPGFGRARVSCNLLVKGELHQYGNEFAFPERFAYAREIGDQRLSVRFIEAHTQFGLSLATDALTLSLSLHKHAPTFDYESFAAANPDKPTLKEVATLGTNICFHHQQQALTMKGTLQMKSGKHKGEAFNIDAMAYRDHSRAIRCDNLAFRHTWSFLYFPDRVFGVVGLCGVLRPSVAANEGYVYDSAGGMRSLQDIEITSERQSDEFLPATVRFKLSDVNGNHYTILADIKNRYGNVPLVVEKPGGGLPAYRIYENFVPLRMESGEEGYALVEIGENPSFRGLSGA